MELAPRWIHGLLNTAELGAARVGRFETGEVRSGRRSIRGLGMQGSINVLRENGPLEAIQVAFKAEGLNIGKRGGQTLFKGRRGVVDAHLFSSACND